MKLLYVDSDLAYASTLCAEMNASGGFYCTFKHVESTDAAFEVLDRSQFDAIVLDYETALASSPDVWGRFEELAPNSPILAIDASDDEHRAVAAFHAGAQDYLAKQELTSSGIIRRIRFSLERRSCLRRALVQSASGVGDSMHSTRDGPCIAGYAATIPESFRDSELDLESRLIQVLVIERADETFRRVDQNLRSSQFPRYRTSRARTLKSGLESLKRQVFDLIVVSCQSTSGGPRETLDSLHQLVRGAAIIFLGDGNQLEAVEALQSGAQDFLSLSQSDETGLSRALVLALIRKVRLAKSIASGSCLKKNDRREEVRPTLERRKYPRFLITKPIFAVPILPDGAPAEAYSADGISIDVSAGGLRFELSGLDYLPTRFILAGIEAENGILYFSTVEVRNSEKTELGIRIGGRFAEGPRNLIRPENLLPSFDPSLGRFVTRLPYDILSKWAQFGIFRPVLMDRIFVCPRCRAIPKCHRGCRNCGSVHNVSKPLIHHFACAHVGFVQEFESNGQIICPKCRAKNLIVGADFEHLNGPYMCLECESSDNELETFGTCLKCEFRFPLHQSVEEELIGYDVYRLDPLALVNAT